MAAPKNASLSEVDPEFAPFIPNINAAFEKIWDFKTAAEFRSKIAGARPSYPPYIPSSGFEISHQKVPVSDGNEIEIRIYRPEGTQEKLPIFYAVHGGGWVVGSHDTEGAVNLSVCVKCRMTVISVDYRQAPEYRYPIPFNDSYEVLQWVIANASSLELDPSRIFVGGSSAGANIVAGICLKAVEDGLKGIIGQVLNIPALCHPRNFPKDKYELLSFEQNKEAPTVNKEHMTWFWDQYLPNANRDIYASPLLAPSFKGLPPTLVQVAGMDPLRDEGIAYAEALKEAGIPTTLKVHKGVPHGFSMITSLKATSDYYETVVDWSLALLATKL